MVTIGKHNFTVVEEAKAPRKYERLFDASTRYEGTSLTDVYGRYSTQKAIVWDSWRDYCRENFIGVYWICSHNTSFFTMAFDVRYEGKWCRAYITPTYNYILIPA